MSELTIELAQRLGNCRVKENLNARNINQLKMTYEQVAQCFRREDMTIDGRFMALSLAAYGDAYLWLHVLSAEERNTLLIIGDKLMAAYRDLYVTPSPEPLLPLVKRLKQKGVI